MLYYKVIKIVFLGYIQCITKVQKKEINEIPLFSPAIENINISGGKY
jgi:hypothetical protein